MSRTRITTLLALALSVASAPARAQYVAPTGAHFYHVSIGLAGGVTVPTGNSPTPIQTGWNGQAYVLIHLLNGLPQLRFNVGYSRSNYDSPNGNTSGVSVPGYFGKQQEVLSGVGGLNINLFHVGPVTPYITAGLGAFDIRTTVDTSEVATGGGGPLPSGSTTSGRTQSVVNFGIDAGGGIALGLGRVSAFVEGRVQNVYTNGGGLIKSSKHIMAVPVSFGVAVGLF
jgi:hypothetical protein